MNTKSPLLLMLDKATEADKKRVMDHMELPSKSVSCRRCDLAIWQVLDRQVVCHCSKTAKISWSKGGRNSVEVTICDVPLLEKAKQKTEDDAAGN